MAQWKFDDKQIKVSDLFKKVEVNGECLTIRLIDGNVLRIDNYYSSARDQIKDIQSMKDVPKEVYDKKQIEAIIDQVDLVMAKKYRDYSESLQEPLLSSMVVLERFAMTLEKIGMRYDAAFNYQYMASDLLCARKGLNIAMEFVEKAKELNDEWKRDNAVASTDVDKLVAYLSKALKMLSFVDPKELQGIDSELRGYDVFKIYPKTMQLWDLGTGRVYVSKDSDEVKKSYDRFFDSLLIEVYIAMAQTWVATNLNMGDKGNEKLLLVGLNSYVSSCVYFFNLARRQEAERHLNQADESVQTIPAKYLEMAQEVFHNAEKAFQKWEPSQEMRDSGMYGSLETSLRKLKDALYG